MLSRVSVIIYCLGIGMNAPQRLRRELVEFRNYGLEY